MTRKEQTSQRSLELYPPIYSSTREQDAFIQGAEWADKTMIDRACEFIKKRFTETIVGNVISRHETTINEVINDLRKEMEGE